MSLEIEDGFNFALGQWLAEFTITLISIAAVAGICAIAYVAIVVYEWWCDRRYRRR
jgi:hypothetical protein